MSIFRFQQFDIQQSENPLKVGTDSMILGAYIPVHDRIRGLDIGAGTGVLSLMALQQNPNLHIDAIEIHPAAAQECMLNVLNSPWPTSVRVHALDFFSFETEEKYDLIFSNPPFYVDGLKSGIETIDQAKHMSRAVFAHFIEKAAHLLADNGVFSFIIPGDQKDFMLELGEESGLFPVRIIAIHANRMKPNKRVIVDFAKQKTVLELGELTIRNVDGTYHDSYIERTKAFHLTNLSK